jgi:hypothetical protein
MGALFRKPEDSTLVGEVLGTAGAFYAVFTIGAVVFDDESLSSALGSQLKWLGIGAALGLASWLIAHRADLRKRLKRGT